MIDFKEGTMEGEKGARVKKVLPPGEVMWKKLREQAKEKMCVNWTPDGVSGCKEFGPQGRCMSCHPRINSIILTCGAAGCGMEHGLQYCPYCKRVYCDIHQHRHRGDKGEYLPMNFPVLESKTKYIPRSAGMVIGSGLVMKEG